jgi:GTPase Era involved in 16S rRNA processing
VTKSDILSEKDRKKFPKWALFVSNITREWIDEVVKAVAKKLPIGPMLYPESDVTDQDVYTRVAEFIREKDISDDLWRSTSWYVRGSRKHGG